MSTKEQDKDNKFSSAMDDLKGLLDKEGITLNTDNNLSSDTSADESSSATHLPTLDGTITIIDEQITSVTDIDGFISDTESEQFDSINITHAIKVQSAADKAEKTRIEILKNNLSIQLTEQIEISVAELKIRLLESMKEEIDLFFKK